MSEFQATRTVVVASHGGLHARAATEVAKVILQFDAKVEIVKDRQRVDGADVLQILSLGAAEGESLMLEAIGKDADAVLDALEQVFAGNFAEDDPTRNQEHQVDDVPQSKAGEDEDLLTG